MDPSANSRASRKTSCSHAIPRSVQTIMSADRTCPGRNAQSGKAAASASMADAAFKKGSLRRHKAEIRKRRMGLKKDLACAVGKMAIRRCSPCILRYKTKSAERHFLHRLLRKLLKITKKLPLPGILTLNNGLSNLQSGETLQDSATMACHGLDAVAQAVGQTVGNDLFQGINTTICASAHNHLQG